MLPGWVCWNPVCRTILHKSRCTWSSNVCKWNTEDGCLSRTTETDCGSTRLMIVLSSYTNANRCQWDVATSKCGWNRDAMNNVCLHPPTGHTTLPDSTRNCAAILKGKCPPAWEVRWFSYVVYYLIFRCLLGAAWRSTASTKCCWSPHQALSAAMHLARPWKHLMLPTPRCGGITP